jgi:hypothetical protein
VLRVAGVKETKGRVMKPDPGREEGVNEKRFSHTRRQVDEKIPNFQSVEGSEMLTNRMNVPTVNVGASFQMNPGVSYEVGEGSLTRPPDFLILCRKGLHLTIILENIEIFLKFLETGQCYGHTSSEKEEGLPD